MWINHVFILFQILVDDVINPNNGTLSEVLERRTYAEQQSQKSGEWESRFEIKLKLSIYCEEETDWNLFDIGKTNWIFSIKAI